MDKLDEFLGSIPNYVHLDFAAQENSGEVDETGAPIPKRIVVVLRFGESNFGFGEITVVQDAEGRVFIDSEQMGRKGVTYFLQKLVKGAILDVDDEPAKHRLYNEVCGRKCGSHCKVCNP